jgi:LysR family transcriptional regulator, hypochlorite-specific transcription factor HypT
MELTWIEDFLVLAQTQNFTEAANLRHTTQPAFSRRIQQLEEWLGTSLFDRAARPVRLTAAGEEFQRRAERIREDIIDARRIAMAAQSNYEKAVRIYTTIPIAIGVLPEWIAGHETPSHSIITSSVAGCTEALRQKRADQILLPWFKGDEKDSQFVYKKVADDVLMPFEKPHLPVSLKLKDKILTGPLLMYTPGTVIGQKVASHFEKNNVSPAETSPCEAAGAETLLALVQQGMGAAWLPQSIVKHSSLKRCDVPTKLDIGFDIMLITRAA